MCCHKAHEVSKQSRRLYECYTLKRQSYLFIYLFVNDHYLLRNHFASIGHFIGCYAIFSRRGKATRNRKTHAYALRFICKY
ncbi:uncharacterized protein P174DRAFT_147371 [Aspergillus novofumigatus IBT 16806]|uniref:Uncharacterized protein n=1 Tax=Aspergillus novofumigatus (strain IBT 16806) TaxID=1392255 RepID=A0A2I1CE21_ASPN1|nr:uncharacterized protein P174DRAFT_147371 [Aspergillus novofumigatus IBT 16806]PKX95858.1 hypothetical protein P174DRAFT_147371 [Aspergillus novofumigatus IBT 16806]